jgi:hypothetical protein
MRLSTVMILIAATAAPLAACNRHGEAPKSAAAKARAVETPTRKPGLWIQTTQVEGIGTIPAVSLCLDAATDKKIAWWGQQGARAGCIKNDVSKNADGSWGFSSVCQSVGNIRATTEGSASGDFKSSYEVRATTTTTGAPMPEMNGTHSVIIDAKWAGPCPSDMKPGDMKLPDGSIANMTALVQGGAPPPAAP